MRAIWFAACVTAVPLLRGGEPSSLRDVRPILDNNCSSCHQPASKQSDLDLTTYDRFQAGGSSRFLCGSSNARTAGASIHGRPKVGAGQASEADAVRGEDLPVRSR